MDITKIFSEYGLLAMGAVLFIVALLLTPVAMKTGILLKIMDEPNARKVHTNPIARTGGLMVFAIIGISIALAPTLLDLTVGKTLISWGMLILLMFALGIVDDVVDLNSKFKFLVQLLVAIELVFVLGYPENLKISFLGTFEVWGWLLAFVFVIWIVGVTNAINLVDGLDGMASGVSLIAATGMLIMASHINDVESIVILLGLITALCGFLFFNLKPAKVFLGDGGSLTIGFVLGGVSLRLMAVDEGISIISFIILLFIPIFDTLWSIVRRKINHKKLFEADRNHLHHKLLDTFGYWKTILTIYFVSFGLMIFVVGLNLEEQELLSLILGIAALLLFVITTIKAGYFKVIGGK